MLLHHLLPFVFLLFASGVNGIIRYWPLEPICEETPRDLLDWYGVRYVTGTDGRPIVYYFEDSYESYEEKYWEYLETALWELLWNWRH
ncbi:unnamed protein product [Cylicocyclus nassatus]|uniref:Uncharacterized protein n=1 Tax=Cylicocyclus nassatus TaxID=53992 RepID=A0AA36GTZ3_CYLNA|nr:unnamed protein product [Cylicocyclus nassatus]